MGLIDDFRKKSDSWMRRFEEHRQEYYNETHLSHEDGNTELSEQAIKKNLEMVGKFDKKDSD